MLTSALAGIPAADAPAERPAPAPTLELPRGGRTILPRYRVVAFFGAPQHRNLGVLGIGSPDRAARKLRNQARPYAAGGRPVMPAFELIAAIALAGPGRDGRYRARQPDAVIRRYLRAARRARALLILDVQPGQSDFLTEVRALRRWLKEPDVSLALDPEWRMRRGQVPGSRIGFTTAAEVNRVSRYVADIVRRGRLPQKLLIVHQFTDSMIRGRDRLARRRGLALTLNVDGVGGRRLKREKYRELAGRRDRFFDGFKVFYEEDDDPLAPRDVLALRPRPDLVVYE